MKKILISLVAGLLLISGAAYAVNSGGWSTNGVVGTTVTVAKNEIHQGSFYAAGQNVRIEGEVRGDLYCAAQKVEIIGKVSGDVLCAAQEVLVSGKVGDDVRLLTQNLNLDNSIGGDLSVFGQSVKVAKGVMVSGDLNGAAQDLNIDGRVVKNLRFGGKRLSLNGEVKGVSDIAFEKVDGNGSFEGDVFYASDEKLPIKSKSGKVVFNEVESKYDANGAKKALFGTVIFVALSMGLFALLIALIAPRFLERSKELVSKKPANVLLFGMLNVLIVPFLALVLMISLVGLPIGVALLLACLLLWLLSGPFFAYFVGSVVAKPVKNVILRMLIGLVIVLVLYLIPVVNILVALAASIVGSGMVVQNLTNGYKKPSYKIGAKVSKKKA
ncbi:hypothetical protein CR956_01790 [Candidatus Saccharibacteria bacterium]|nr:MAG: hypothetical protein CR956_01790 [Candidatus Saccharibacteria bacterium]